MVELSHRTVSSLEYDTVYWMQYSHFPLVNKQLTHDFTSTCDSYVDPCRQHICKHLHRVHTLAWGWCSLQKPRPSSPDIRCDPSGRHNFHAGHEPDAWQTWRWNLSRWGNITPAELTLSQLAFTFFVTILWISHFKICQWIGPEKRPGPKKQTPWKAF